MAVLKCKMCGGDIELSQDKTFGTCDSCGSTMTFPKVDDEQRANMFNRGNHFRRMGEFDKALAVYERIVQEDENDAEAHWCCALCRFGIEYVEDPNTFEYLPTCHRASFDSFLEDVDYLAALEHSDGITRRQYQKDAAKIAEVQRGILATSQNEEPFDVFICYKESENDGTRTRDSLMAQEIYYQLTEQGRRVFFSRITLEDKAGTEYEPYIFAALNSAKVMIVVTTSAEHVNAVWVKNEWSRFLSLMRKDRSKLLLPCYRDMDPYDLPEALSVLQSYDMSKIGFIQDLTRGINKVLDASKPKTKETVKETVVVQQGNSNAAPLLKRAFMFLEDGEFSRADEFCEQVLNLDPENAEAYLGKLMAELKVKTRDALKDQPEQFDNSSNYQKAMRFGDNDLKEELLAYLDFYNMALESRRGNIQKIAKEVKNRFIFRSGSLIGLRANGTVVSTKYTGDKKYYHGQDQVSEWKDIVAIETGLTTTIGLKADGTVVATKYSGDQKDYYGTDQVSGWKDIIAVKCSFCTIGLKVDGTVIATKYIGPSYYYYGQDQVSDWKNIIAIETGPTTTIGLKADGTVIATKYIGESFYHGQDQVSRWKDIIAAKCSSDCTIGLKKDGTVVATKYIGDQKYYSGEDQVSEWKNITAVTFSGGCTVGLKADGTVVATKYTGDQKYYHGTDQVSEWKDIVAIEGGFCTIGLKADGTVVATKYTGDQKYYHGQDQVSEWKDIVAIAAGGGRTFGLKMDGTVVATKYIGDQNEMSDIDNVDGWQLFDSFEELEAANERIEKSIKLRKEQAKEIMRKKAEEAERQAAELRRREEAAAAALRVQKREEYSKQLAAAKQRKQSAETELANLKGLFSGKRRRELQETIEHNEKEIMRLQAELKQLQD